MKLKPLTPEQNKTLQTSLSELQINAMARECVKEYCYQEQIEITENILNNIMELTKGKLNNG